MVSDTVTTPQSGTYIENIAVTLTAYTDSTHTTKDTTARIYWQRYAQSNSGIFDIAQRSNLAGMNFNCVNVRFFDPDKVPTPMYSAPSECEPIAYPIEPTDSALQAAYERGDFSILIEGYDAVNDLGFTIRSMYNNSGDPILFSEFVPGNIYINPRLGMFMFFHYPDRWDSCSYWDFAWWDDGLLSPLMLSSPPYVTDWDAINDVKAVVNLVRVGSTVTVTCLNPHGWLTTDKVSIRGAIQEEYNVMYTSIIVTGPNTFTYTISSTPAPATAKYSGFTAGKAVPIPTATLGVLWDGQIEPGWALPDWDDTNNPIPINTYWDTVSEAPTEDAKVLVSYWTKDNTDPLEPRGGGIPNESYNYRNERFTSPITLATDTQLRFRSINGSSQIEDTKTETYVVGLRLQLQKGVNLISQPYEVSSPEADLDNIFSGLDLLQIFRLENGLWKVYVPSTNPDNDPVYNSLAFDTIDNKHGLFVIMNDLGTFCFPYGDKPETTELTLVDKTTNQGINAIAVPRSSLQDNSIDNILVSRGIQFDEIQRVTNGMFETYIPDRATILNFSPAELSPGRGYGIVTSETQTFELPFID